jgi:hypothetical protein
MYVQYVKQKRLFVTLKSKKFRTVILSQNLDNSGSFLENYKEIKKT